MQDDIVAPASPSVETAGNAADIQPAASVPAAPVADSVSTEQPAVATQEPVADPVKPVDPAPAVPTFRVGREVFDSPEALEAFANKMYGQTGNLVGELRRQNPNLSTTEIEAIKASGGTVSFVQPSATTPTEISAPTRDKLRILGYEDDAQVVNMAKAIDLLAADQGYVKRSDPLIDPAVRPEYEAATMFFQKNPSALQYANAMGTLMDTAKASGHTMTIDQAHQAVLQIVNPQAEPVIKPAPPEGASGMGGGNAAGAPAPAVTNSVSPGISSLINLR